MALRVRSVPLLPGYEVPVLVRDGVQIYETSWWLVDSLLPSSRGVAPNTLVVKLRSVAHWLQWAEAYNFNWVTAVQSGQFMSVQTIKRVLEWMEMEVDLLGPNRVKRLKLNSSTAGARAGFLYQFLDWYADRLVAALPQNGFKLQVVVSFENWRARWQTTSQKMFPGSSPVRPPETMSEEQRELFLRVIRVADPGNPWQAGQQARNYAILILMYEHGLRISDVLQLRMDDLQMDKGWFKISERIEDPYETRKRRPNPKRRGATVRTLRFTALSFTALQAWLS